MVMAYLHIDTFMLINFGANIYFCILVNLGYDILSFLTNVLEHYFGYLICFNNFFLKVASISQ